MSYLDRHIKDFSDGLALVMHFQSLAVVASSMADLAGNINIGKEVHLDGDSSIAGTVLAATAFNVEGETTLLIAAHLSFGSFSKERADLIEYPGICRRIRTRCATDW